MLFDLSMKVLVTGGAGFIGSHIVDKLIDLGYEVIVVDNFRTGSPDNLNKKAIFYNLDIINRDAVARVFEEHAPSYVFHTAAGYLVHSIEDPQGDAMTNIVGSINIIELCIKHKVRRLIYSNSGGASYGDPLFIPLTEEHPINPLTPYGISKHTVEHYLHMYHKNYGLDYISLRYGNIYGPRQNPKLEGGVISVFLDSLLRGKGPEMKSDGTPTRDYCYVGDVVEANLLAMEKGKCGAYHVATGIETSVLGLYRTLQKVLGIEIDYVQGKPRVGDPQRAVFSIEKIKKELGWYPKTSLEEGIKKTVQWCRDRIRLELQAIILAAGIGERMLPLTKDIPKPMLQINNKPILEYNLRLLKKYNFTNVGFTTFYLKDKIIYYFGDGSNRGMNLYYFEENELLPSARALRLMDNLQSSNVLVINGDNITDLNLSELADFHQKQSADITIVSYLRNPDSAPSSQVDFGDSLRVEHFREKLSSDELKNISPEKRWANAGIYMFKREIISSISEKDTRDLGQIIPEFVKSGLKVFTFPMPKSAYFAEVGKIEKYESAKKDIEGGKVKLNI